MTGNRMKEHDKAEEIIRSYKWYHAGTAIVAGALGGQFGLDRIPLTALTISMIKEICGAYGITEPLPVTIHCISAIVRLTYKGTVAGVALNWLPGGSLINGGVTFVLTSQCGHECMLDIEKERMGSIEQLTLAFGRSAVTFACELLGKAGDKVSGKIVDGICESLEISEPLHEVKKVVSSSVTGTAMSVMSGKGLPSLCEFLLTTIPMEVLNVSFTELAQRNGSFVNNRNAVIRHLQQMRTGNPAFETFDNQLDQWIEQTRRTPDRKELHELVKIFDNEFVNLFGGSIPGKLAGRSAAWVMADKAGNMARNGDFVPVS